MKKHSLTTAFLLLICSVLCAQDTIPPVPMQPGEGRQLPRTQLISYPSQALALKGDPMASSYYRAVDPEWKRTVLPVGMSFTSRYNMPFAWIDREIFLRIPSVAASYEVKVNGQSAGLNLSPRTSAEFDITKLSKEGYNDVEITILADPAYNIDGPQARSEAPAGVCVISQPRLRVRDMVADAAVDGTNGLLNLGLVVETHLLNSKSIRIHYELLAPDGSQVASSYRDEKFEMRGQDTIRFFARIDSVQVWDAAAPTLYTIVAKIQQDGRYLEYVPAKIGFHTLEVKDGKMVFNGLPLNIKATVFAPTGNMSADSTSIMRFKADGVNILRLSDPQPQAFYSLCDRLGMFVCDASGIDTYSSGDSRAKQGNPSNDPELCPLFVDRAVNMYHCSKLHPSVLMFSIAVNSYNGINLYEAYRALKAIEKQRPIIYLEAGGEWNTDADPSMNGSMTFR